MKFPQSVATESEGKEERTLLASGVVLAFVSVAVSWETFTEWCHIAYQPKNYQLPKPGSHSQVIGVTA